MALSEEKIREYQRRLLLSRMRILCHHGFYGLLLMHMRYAIDEALPPPIPTANGSRSDRHFWKSFRTTSWIL